MDLSRVKRVTEETNHFRVEHIDHKPFKVAKSLLSSQSLVALQKFCNGGKIGYDDGSLDTSGAGVAAGLDPGTNIAPEAQLPVLTNIPPAGPALTQQQLMGLPPVQAPPQQASTQPPPVEPDRVLSVAGPPQQSSDDQSDRVLTPQRLVAALIGPSALKPERPAAALIDPSAPPTVTYIPKPGSIMGGFPGAHARRPVTANTIPGMPQGLVVGPGQTATTTNGANGAVTTLAPTPPPAPAPADADEEPATETTSSGDSLGDKLANILKLTPEKINKLEKAVPSVFTNYAKTTTPSSEQQREDFERQQMLAKPQDTTRLPTVQVMPVQTQQGIQYMPVQQEPQQASQSSRDASAFIESVMNRRAEQAGPHPLSQLANMRQQLDLLEKRLKAEET